MPNIDYSTTHIHGNGKTDGQFPVFHACPPDSQSQEVRRVQIESLVVNWIRDFIIAWRMILALLIVITGGTGALYKSGLLHPSEKNTVSVEQYNRGLQEGINGQILAGLNSAHEKIDNLTVMFIENARQVNELAKGHVRLETTISLLLPSPNGRPPQVLFRAPAAPSQIAAPAQPAPLPAAANPSPKKSKPKPKPATTGVAGWFAKIGG